MFHHWSNQKPIGDLFAGFLWSVYRNTPELPVSCHWMLCSIPQTCLQPPPTVFHQCQEWAWTAAYHVLLTLGFSGHLKLLNLPLFFFFCLQVLVFFKVIVILTALVFIKLQAFPLFSPSPHTATHPLPLPKFNITLVFSISCCVNSSTWNIHRFSPQVAAWPVECIQHSLFLFRKT